MALWAAAYATWTELGEVESFQLVPVGTITLFPTSEPENPRSDCIYSSAECRYWRLCITYSRKTSIRAIEVRMVTNNGWIIAGAYARGVHYVRREVAAGWNVLLEDWRMKLLITLSGRTKLSLLTDGLCFNVTDLFGNDPKNEVGMNLVQRKMRITGLTV